MGLSDVSELFTPGRVIISLLFKLPPIYRRRENVSKSRSFFSFRDMVKARKVKQLLPYLLFLVRPDCKEAWVDCHKLFVPDLTQTKDVIGQNR